MDISWLPIFESLSSDWASSTFTHSVNKSFHETSLWSSRPSHAEAGLHSQNSRFLTSTFTGFPIYRCGQNGFWRRYAYFYRFSDTSLRPCRAFLPSLTFIVPASAGGRHVQIMELVVLGSVPVSLPELELHMQMITYLFRWFSDPNRETPK